MTKPPPEEPEISIARQIVLIVEEDGQRVDVWLTGQLPDVSRSAVQRWIKEKLVLINDHVVRASQRVATGDRLQISIPAPIESVLRPENIPLDIVYEDTDLLVVNKPAGMVVHPAPGHSHGTLVNALLYRVPDLAGIGGVLRPGIVHRLDKETSGLLLVAKNDPTLRALQAQFKAHQVEKRYLALLEGHLTPDKGRIEAPIGRDSRHRQRMGVVHNGRPAITEYEIRAYYGAFTLVDVHLLTGRTHQIRVHFAYLKHPVVGDTIYGYQKQRLSPPLNRFFLHAYLLRFTHPADGQRISVESPLPSVLQTVLDRFLA